jgi:formate hydrogenlyase subunit 6/NADH:ubiquinone oxidoreductase subunit I
MDGSDVPVVDADTCITCFCCQEICPEMAMSLQAQAA